MITTPVEYDVAIARLRKLVEEYDTNNLDLNEATTRLRFIDVLFFECLGWERTDCYTESHYQGDYSDYEFNAPYKQLVVEAKRTGNYLDLPEGVSGLIYSIGAIVRGYPRLGDAVTQVASYSQQRGIQLAAVTNGHQVIAFIGNRSDGIPPLEGKAIVFPSLKFMVDNFQELWDMLSKPGVAAKHFQHRLLGTTEQSLPRKLSATIADYDSLKGRNPFQVDLKIVSELVLQDVISSQALEEQFLNECYSASGALSDYVLQNRTILQSRYEALFDEHPVGITTVPAVQKSGISDEFLKDVSVISTRPILLLGDIGVGKTTFLKYLVSTKVIDTTSRAIVFNIDLGAEGILTTQLKTFIVERMILSLEQHYEIDIFSDHTVRSIYHSELTKFSTRSIYAPLKEMSPSEYLRREIEFLEQKLSNRLEHLKQAVRHLQKSHRRQIVIILDNSDQRQYSTQQEVFLFANEIAATWSITTYVTMRPETFYLSLTGGGTISAYSPKAFTISPPRIEHVIEKRLKFAIKLASGEIPVAALQSIVNLHNLRSLLNVLQFSLRQNGDLYKFIVNISGGNVRRALDIIKTFLTGDHLNVEKILRIWNEKGFYNISLHEFLRVVIFGDYIHYNPDRSFIANLFDITSLDEREYFLLCIILKEMEVWSGVELRNGFIETASIYKKIQSYGYNTDQINAVLLRGERFKLIETSTRRKFDVGNIPHSLRATTVGLYHVNYLTNFFQYFNAIVVDIPILDQGIRDQVFDVDELASRLSRVEVILSYLTDIWKRTKHENLAFNWMKCADHVFEDIEGIRESVTKKMIDRS